IESLAARGATVFATSDKAGGKAALPIAATGNALTDPLALIASFYGFVESFSRARGLDPDQPPHLRKVTETV
ncbi:MAG: aminotransferase, partial [Nitratireductor sp.]